MQCIAFGDGWGGGERGYPESVGSSRGRRLSLLYRRRGSRSLLLTLALLLFLPPTLLFFLAPPLLGLTRLAFGLLPLALLKPGDVTLLVLHEDELRLPCVLNLSRRRLGLSVLSPVEPHSAIRLEDDLSGLPGLPLLDLFDEHRDHLGDVTLGELFENLPFARLEEDLCATELVAARRDL